MGDRLKVSAVLRAIRAHARFMKKPMKRANRRPVATVQQQADAIIALALIGSDLIRAANEG